MAAVAALLMIAAARGLLVEGVFSWHMKQKEFIGMMIELFLYFWLASAVLLFAGAPIRKFIGIILLSGVFCWLHQIFVPIVLAVLYIGYICVLGSLLRVCVFRLQTKVNRVAEFLLGSAALILLYCLMSVAGLGSIRNIKIVLLVTGLPMAGYMILKWKLRWGQVQNTIKKTWSFTWPSALILAGILTFLLIQAGRMNLALDYDSFWYGVRSEYILNNGKGIYENLGTVGLVYSYSKGLEILVLPLSDLTSHSYLLAFNLVCAVLVLYTAYGIVTLFTSKAYGLFTCLMLVSIPGIMNMSITAKSDILTLLYQLMILLFVMNYLYDKEVKYLILAGSAMLISWTLKPTAMVFSTALMGMSGLYLIFTKCLKWKTALRYWLVGVLSFLVLILVWARTFLLVGVPVTSVFSSFFTRLGFEMRYPYGSRGINNYSPNLFSKEGLLYMGKRLYGLFINPSDERMNHVVIAWGTILVTFAVILLIICFWKEKSLSDISRTLRRYLFTVYLPLVFVCFVSMMMLYRPDGNYFMLFYAMTVILAGICLYYIRIPQLRKGLSLLIVPLLIFNLLITALSSWSWTLGFTPIKILHRGYYNHEAVQHQEMVQLGNQQIWGILEQNPRTRVIAIGYHPQVLSFPCNVQSYYDVWNWGSAELIHSASAFKQYLEYAKTDYLYIQGGFVDHGSKYSRMISKLILDGVLTELLYEEGNILAKVDLSASSGENVRKNYEDFLSGYNFYVDESTLE